MQWLQVHATLLRNQMTFWLAAMGMPSNTISHVGSDVVSAADIPIPNLVGYSEQEKAIVVAHQGTDLTKTYVSPFSFRRCYFLIHLQLGGLFSQISRLFARSCILIFSQAHQPVPLYMLDLHKSTNRQHRPTLRKSEFSYRSMKIKRKRSTL